MDSLLFMVLESYSMFIVDPVVTFFSTQNGVFSPMPLESEALSISRVVALSAQSRLLVKE